MVVAPAVPLFGRDEVLAPLQGRLDELREAGSGGFAVGLTGEPGVGKSAVAERLAHQAVASGFTVLRARGSQSEAHLAYACLHQLLRPLLPRASELPTRQRESLLTCFGMADVDGAEGVNPFFTALASLELLAEAAGEAPLLVCIDDLHWVDRPSVDTLAFVARRIATEPLVLLVTSRPGEELLGDEQGLTWLRLDGLPDEAAVELVRSRAPALEPRLRDRVVEHAGGNPLALIEFAGAVETGSSAWSDLAQDLPMSTRLERAFAARADELAAETRAAICGAEPSPAS